MESTLRSAYRTVVFDVDNGPTLPGALADGLVKVTEVAVEEDLTGRRPAEVSAQGRFTTTARRGGAAPVAVVDDIWRDRWIVEAHRLLETSTEEGNQAP